MVIKKVFLDFHYSACHFCSVESVKFIFLLFIVSNGYLSVNIIYIIHSIIGVQITTYAIVQNITYSVLYNKPSSFIFPIGYNVKVFLCEYIATF